MRRNNMAVLTKAELKEEIRKIIRNDSRGVIGVTKGDLLGFIEDVIECDDVVEQLENAAAAK
jgi:hypothetical protein